MYQQPQQPPQWQRPQQNTQYPPQWQPKPPYPQQPYQSPPVYYPPQQYYQQLPPVLPPPPPPKKPDRGREIAGFVIAGLVLLCFICGVIRYPNSVTPPTISTTQATDTPVQQSGTWTTTHNFTGNGAKKTEIFPASNDWKLVWTCQGFNDGTGINGDLIVSIYDANNNLVDLGAIYATCKAGSQTTTGETEEHRGGQVYLDVHATGDWTIDVQELQ